MGIRRNTILAIVLLVLSNGPVQAVLVGGGRFDLLIKNAEIVVKVRVTQINDSRFEMIAFRANVVSVLKGDGRTIPNELQIEAPFPIWPEDLGTPFAKNQIVLLVLSRKSGKVAIRNNLRAIIPATESEVHYSKHSSVVRKVFDELHAFLPQVEGRIAKGLVLIHISQLALKADEQTFIPYLKSEDEWLRRAALASLLRINPTPERIQAGVADFENHISKPESHTKYSYSKDYLFWKMYQNVQWAARCGSFGMEKELVERAKAYLPLYRTLIDKAPPNYQRVRIAIDALRNVGTKEDIPRLYKYVDHEKASIRHNVLEGLGRILHVKMKRPSITSYMMPLPPDVEPWERKTRSIIEEILANEGLIER